MKSITNDSLQAFEITLHMPNGAERRWLGPKQTLVVQASAISPQIALMAKRRILRIRNV